MQGFLVVLLILALAFMGAGWYLSMYYRCPSCKERIRTTYHYCPHCGSSFPDPESPRNSRLRNHVSNVKPLSARKLSPRAMRRRPAQTIDATRAELLTRTIRQLPEAEPDRRTPLSRLLARSHCPSCQALAHGEDAFCGQCGTALPLPRKRTTQ